MFCGFSPENLVDFLGNRGMSCEAIRSTDLGPIEGPAERAVIDAYANAGLYVAIASIVGEDSSVHEFAVYAHWSEFFEDDLADAQERPARSGVTPSC